MVNGSDATRRGVLKTGAALATFGSVAGCTGTGDTGETPDETATATGSPTETAGGGETATETSYSVSIEPVGEVEFDAVPETWVANNGSWADMGIALGQDPPEGVWLTSRYHTQYYDEIPGVEVDASGMVDLSQDGHVSKELFYELDGDVHVLDPNFLRNRFDGFDEGDVAEIEDQVGPFFGNSIFSRDYSWHEEYRYYTLYEAFEKLSEVFRERERFEAMDAIHDEFRDDLAAVVPDEGERPGAAVVWGAGDEPTEFLPYVIDEGTSFKHLNDLAVGDALANSDVKDFHSSRGAIDFETLLEVDPEVLLLRGQEAKTGDEFEDTVVSFMADHDVASDLAAVENGNVYRAGPLYQGPITNLVVTERLARELYDRDEELFDRQRVADVVNGEF